MSVDMRGRLVADPVRILNDPGMRKQFAAAARLHDALERVRLSNKKKSPRKFTKQEMDELLALMQEAYEFIDQEFKNSHVNAHADSWIARAYKILGKP
mgnify:FL=1